MYFCPFVQVILLLNMSTCKIVMLTCNIRSSMLACKILAISDQHYFKFKIVKKKKKNQMLTTCDFQHGRCYLSLHVGRIYCTGMSNIKFKVVLCVNSLFIFSTPLSWFILQPKCACEYKVHSVTSLTKASPYYSTSFSQTDPVTI